jgi:predicted Zn-dependent protease
LVLDEEFNQACHTLAAPVVPVLVPTTPFHCVLVNDDSINAFVTKENIVYLHAGLIRQASCKA